MFPKNIVTSCKRTVLVITSALTVQLIILAAFSKLTQPGKTNRVSRVAIYGPSDIVTSPLTTTDPLDEPKSTITAPSVLLVNRPPLERCTKRFPSAIIVGIQKCGTTALIKFLGLHPQIVYPHGEVKFFTTRYRKGSNWYRNRMPCSRSQQISIERSPGYFYRPYTAQRINEFNPDMKLIFIVKDPIVRAQSMFAMVHHNDGTSFQTVLTDDSGQINNDTKILHYSTYPLHMKQWLDRFRLDQMCFVDGHNFERHPEEELRIIEKFLNVAPFFESENFWINKDKGKPCFYKKKKLHCLTKRKGRSHPEIADDFRKTLESHFKPLNEQFFGMINQSFEWGY